MSWSCLWPFKSTKKPKYSTKFKQSIPKRNALDKFFNDPNNIVAKLPKRHEQCIDEESESFNE